MPRYQSPLLIKSKLVTEYLVFLTRAFGRLFEDAKFLALLEANGITDMPEPLAMRMKESKTPPALIPPKLNSFARQARVAEQSYAKDVLTLSVSCAYVYRLVAIAKIAEYLNSFHPDIFAGLQRLLSEAKPKLLE